MHDPKFLRQNRDKVEAGIALKGVELDLARFYQLEERRLAVLHETEQLKARRNAASEDIAKLGRDDEARVAYARSRELTRGEADRDSMPHEVRYKRTTHP